MFEQFGFETLTPMQASFVFALIVGIVFGALAQHLKFCFRTTVVGNKGSKPVARGIWFIALGAALLGTQFLVVNDYISFNGHRFFEKDLPILAIVFGGILFGIGMVLTRGCISRLTVLAGTGNLRALTVIIVFAILAHATLKGFLACAVANSHVLAIEAYGGTEWMLRSLIARSEAWPSGGILFKAPKTGQERRIDLPAIGPATCQQVKKAGLDGIVIAYGGVVVLDMATVISEANRLKLFFWVRESLL